MIRHHLSIKSFTIVRSVPKRLIVMAATRGNIAVLVDKPSKEKSIQGPLARVAEVDMPSLSDDLVLVKLLLRPVNPSDVASVSSTYPGFNRSRIYPATPGLEGVGVVEELASTASKLRKGQRVIARGWGADQGNGTWQQYRAVPESNLLVVPDTVSDESAAQAMVNPMTCYGFLEVLQIPEGKWFLQSAGNSELGIMMIALCKSRKIKTISIVRREDAAEQVRNAGGDEVVVDTGNVNIAERVKAVTGGEMAYGATDAVTGDMTGKLAAAVRPEGQVLVYGAMGGIVSNGISVRDTLFRGVSVTGFWLNRFMQALDQAAKQQALEAVMQLLANGVIKPRAGPKFPLEKVNEALAASGQPGKTGKVFLEG